MDPYAAGSLGGEASAVGESGKTQARCAWCDGEATNACGCCLARYYCSRQCQTSHWKEEHRNECSVLALSTVQSRQLEIYGMVLKGEFSQAEENFRRLIPFAERVCAPKLDVHVQAMAGLLFDWGNLLGRRGKLQEANEVFSRGEALLEEPSKVQPMSLLCHGRAMRASVLRKLNCHAEALQLLKQTIVWLRELVKVAPDVTQALRLALNERTLLLVRLGRLADAEAACRESLSLFLPGLPVDAAVEDIASFAVPPDAHHDLGTTLSLLADLRRLQGHPREARLLVATALQVAEQCQVAINPLVANTIRQLVRLDQGPEECIDLCERAVRLWRDEPKGGPSASLSMMLLSWAMALQKAGRDDEADVSLTEAVAVGKEAAALYGPHPQLGEALCVLAEREVKHGQLEVAVQLFAQAADVFERCDGGAHSLEGLTWLSQYAPTLRTLGRPDEAARVEEKLGRLRAKMDETVREALQVREKALQFAGSEEEDLREQQLLQQQQQQQQIQFDFLQQQQQQQQFGYLGGLEGSDIGSILMSKGQQHSFHMGLTGIAQPE